MIRTLLVSLLLFISVALAEIPELLNYQGVLKNADGELAEDANYAIAFSLYDAPAGLTPIWQELQVVQTANGVFHAVLGVNNPIGDLFSGNAYLGISINGGTELVPRKQIVSVGYAFESRNAEFAMHSQVSDTSAYATVAGNAQLFDGMPSDAYRILTAFGSVASVTCEPSAWTTLLEVDITIPETMLVYSFGTVSGGGWWDSNRMLQLSLYNQNYSVFYPYSNPWGDIANAHHLLPAGTYHIQLYGLNMNADATDMGDISIYALAVPVPENTTSVRSGPFTPPASAILPDPNLFKQD
ncbi:MAG: hypothetical protein HOB84_02230 [Candidatus Marinimicrobia bacterium]|nr:hypothetical protein [Candidatus Neomarinimicrobiota bacterium]MBT5270227.1 hypothetical protein [Candidatus Neomarinimicrobiota bacterium]MBT7578104.1 hypothetical protein [Candidatus Neomarinimicrobiota bacterium]